MRDPLAGKREAINRGELDTLAWSDEGKGCPVEVGQLYPLRTCTVEITRTERRREHGRFVWRAWFTRIFYDRSTHLLTRGAGIDGRGYTSDVDQAVSAQDDPDAATLISLHPEENPLNSGPPPEPESVPPHEVKVLPSSVTAQKRFRQKRRDEDRRRSLDAVARRIKALNKRAERQGLDLDSEIAELEATMDRVERVVTRKAAA